MTMGNTLSLAQRSGYPASVGMTTPIKGTGYLDIHTLGPTSPSFQATVVPKQR